MAVKVLVAYGSKYGATTEIADKIGHVLAEEGLETDVLSAEKVKSVEGYAAFVIGSAAYIGMWRKQVTSFVKKNEKALAARPVWIFSSGPTDKGDAVAQMKGWLYPNSLKTVIDNIKPKDITVFHGFINPEKMGWFEKWMIKNVKSGIGDARDWDMITKWAKGIAAQLKK